MALSVAIALSGIYLAWRWYVKEKEIPARLQEKTRGLYTLLWNKYYVDEVYDAAVVTPVVRGSERLLWKIVDVGVIDWTVNALAHLFGWLARTVRVVQTGIAESYLLAFVLGAFLIIGWLILK